MKVNKPTYIPKIILKSVPQTISQDMRDVFNKPLKPNTQVGTVRVNLIK